jgi:hypothetical protein
MKAVRIENGIAEEIEIGSGLDSLQKAVGGWIELLPINDEHHAYIDEEGKLKNLPINELATKFAHKYIGIAPYDCIVGPMIILGNDPSDPEEEGDANTPTVISMVATLVGRK